MTTQAETGIETQPRQVYTEADFWAFPNDGYRREIIEGELYVHATPSLYHQVVLGRLFRALIQFAEERRAGLVFLAPAAVVLSELVVCEPDIVFVAKERRSILTDRSVKGPPDLVVEVLSPSTRLHDRLTKRSTYAQHGVREYWIVDPDKHQVELYDFERDRERPIRIFFVDDTLESPLLKGFTLSLRSLFRRIDADLAE